MRFRALLAAFLLLPSLAVAQDVRSPLPPPVSVATNAALKGLALPSGRVIRDGFYAAGDGGGMTYTYAASNCTAADDGVQVQPTGRTGCWVADPAAPLYFEVWGAKGDGSFDDGPAIRAALAFGASAGKPIRVRKKGYLLNSLDPSGLGAIVLGTGATGTSAPSADLIGEGTQLLPDNVYALGGPFLKLGNGLNRPLVYVQRNTRNPTWTGLALSGNRAGQTGWTGGPSGLLYTVQIADDTVGGGVESGFRMDGVVMRDGYNGNLYLGSGRGGLWLKDTWSVYSGQATTDLSIFLNGYDATLINSQAGSNAGDGVYAAQGAQYQLIGGAYYLNGGRGLRINGSKVQHLVATSLNFQGNGFEGVSDLNNAPYAGTQGGLHAFSNLVFEGNSASASGTYSDIKVDTSTLVTLTAVGFPGRIITSGQFGSLPKYNIELAGGARVALAGISLGSSPGVGTSYATGFTNACAQLTGDVPVACTWTPTLLGGSTAGAPVYVRQFGAFTRTGKTIVASFVLDTSDLGGAAGQVYVGNLPLTSQSANSADYGVCTIANSSGWTAPGGQATLGGFVSPNSSIAGIYSSGSAGGAAAGATFAQFAASTRLWGTCTYRVAN